MTGLRRLFSNIKGLADGVINGDRSSLARAITMVESKLKDDFRNSQDLFKQLNAIKSASKTTMRVGISGSPGVGKSSLIEALGMYCVEGEGLKVAILAIDPSSQNSGGSILGDKTRMPRLASHSNAFIRPSPSGGQLGGVARGTFSSIKLFAGFDVIFVESVGVGQSEYQLANLTDIFVLCTSPGSGDDLQAMKRGISEAADLILLNKAEEPLSQDARVSLAELQVSQTLRNRPAQIIPVSAREGNGIKEAWSVMRSLQSEHIKSGQFEHCRKQQESIWIKSFLESELSDRFKTYLNLDKNSKKISLMEDADLSALTDEIIKDFCCNQVR